MKTRLNLKLPKINAKISDYTDIDQKPKMRRVRPKAWFYVMITPSLRVHVFFGLQLASEVLGVKRWAIDRRIQQDGYYLTHSGVWVVPARALMKVRANDGRALSDEFYFDPDVDLLPNPEI